VIKSVFMLVVGGVIAVGSALTGIGALPAAESAVDFLLGFTAERVAGTSIAFSLVAAACGAIGAGSAKLHIETGQALILAVAAFVGALLANSIAVNDRFKAARRLAQSLAMLVCVFVLQSAVRAGPFGVRTWDIELFHGPAGWALLGAAAGALSRAFFLASGVLLVPALIYLAGLEPARAIITSLAVVTFASVLPTLSYLAKGAVDKSAGFGMILGGGLGGCAGGYVLATSFQHSTLPLILFAVVAMFLSARTIYKMS
jgi:uncharacterized membrane protein YfcA